MLKKLISVINLRSGKRNIIMSKMLVTVVRRNFIRYIIEEVDIGEDLFFYVFIFFRRKYGSGFENDLRSLEGDYGNVVLLLFLYVF